MVDFDQGAGHIVGSELMGMAVRQERMALQTPEQTPEGPVPDHFPWPWHRMNRPLPLATRGPATAVIRVCPSAPEMRPSIRIR